MTTRKLFIDTDAGTDDAIALMMAMQDPNIEIVGISTSGGNVSLDKVVQNVLYVRELCRDVSPVYAGAAQPLQRKLGTADFIHGSDGLGDIGLSLEGRIPDPGIGSQRLCEAIVKYEDELELVCLGPLTNIALAHQESPKILRKVKETYIMGGLVSLPGNVTSMSEYNIWADPEAADIVLKSGAKMTMIGWDTTLCCSNLSMKELENIRSLDTDLAKFAVDIQKQRIAWMKKNMDEIRINLADPLAMSVVLNAGLAVNHSRYKMSVRGGHDGDEYRGYIDALPTESDRSVKFIHEIDRRGFIQLLSRTLGNNNELSF